jgi:hypothetical protein
MISGLADWSRILGPALFGAVAGGMYGYVSVVTEKPLAEGTTGWTSTGKRLALTARIASYGPLGTSLLTLADRDAVPTERLRRAMVALDELIAMQGRAEAYAQQVEDMGEEVAREQQGEWRGEQQQQQVAGGGRVRDAEFVTTAQRYRSIALAMVAEGLADKDVGCGPDGIPYDDELRYAVATVVQCADDLVFNIVIAAGKWRGG